VEALCGAEPAPLGMGNKRREIITIGTIVEVSTPMEPIQTSKQPIVGREHA